MPAAIFADSSYEFAMPNFGADKLFVFSNSPNAPRSSAKSIASGEVPNIGMPASNKPRARPNGVWPPSCAMTPNTGPAEYSAAITSKTSSKVNGSKYNLSEVS